LFGCNRATYFSSAENLKKGQVRRSVSLVWTGGKVACCGFPDADVVTLARLVKGEACPFGVALWWECDRVGRPCYEVGFVGGKVDEADKAVGETLDTVPRCTAPDLDSLAMEGGEVCPKG
jgi:hypothetical protein